MGFEIENRATPIGRDFEPDSIFGLVRRAFGAEVLRKSYRSTSQALGELINREFYQNRIQFLPTAAEYQGEQTFELVLVDEDNRAKTTIEGATESLDAELEKTVELIFNHALWHPQQSLLVASASKVHADRIREVRFRAGSSDQKQFGGILQRSRARKIRSHSACRVDPPNC